MKEKVNETGLDKTKPLNIRVGDVFSIPKELAGVEGEGNVIAVVISRYKNFVLFKTKKGVKFSILENDLYNARKNRIILVTSASQRATAIMEEQLIKELIK